MTELEQALKWQADGKIWVTPAEAGPVLKCDPYSLNVAAMKKGSLGGVKFLWSGNSLKISVQSIILFLSGGRPIDEIRKGVMRNAEG